MGFFPVLYSALKRRLVYLEYSFSRSFFLMKKTSTNRLRGTLKKCLKEILGFFPFFQNITQALSESSCLQSNASVKCLLFLSGYLISNWRIISVHIVVEFVQVNFSSSKVLEKAHSEYLFLCQSIIE